MQENLTEEERISKQRELVESLGMFTNRSGGTALAGRILGLLSFMDKEEYTFEEIVDDTDEGKITFHMSAVVPEIVLDIAVLVLVFGSDGVVERHHIVVA